MQTRKHPRTMAEAFGPYAGHEITEPREPIGLVGVLIYAASVVAVLVVTYKVFF